MSDIVLSRGIRSNLLNLQRTADMTSKTQNRLATGKKVNTALDNPTNFFTSASLQSRATDLGALLDGISNGIQTLQAADTGLTAITHVVESMQSTVRQARQDKTWESQTFDIKSGGETAAALNVTFTGGAFGSAGTPVDLAAADLVANGGNADGITTVDEMVKFINEGTATKGKLIANNDNGVLRIKNVSASDLQIDGMDALGGASTTNTATETIAKNDTRASLVKQFNDLRDQLDKLSEDASFNGVNLLQGDKLTLYFNETGTSTIDIQAVDDTGTPKAINSMNLGIDYASISEFENDSKLDTRLDGLKSALDQIHAQASTFGSNLSVVENRQDFTKTMINTLNSGADNLTLADQNEEAANLLALQTRQQLSQTALSLANQADQGVLKLF